MILQRFKQVPNFFATFFNMSLLAWQANPFCLLGLLGLKIAQGLFPLGTAWLTKVLFDLLARSLHGEHIPTLPTVLLLLLAAQGAFLILNQLLTPLNQYLTEELTQQLSLLMQTRIYAKTASFAGLAYFEDPSFHDTIHLATQRAQSSPMQAVNSLSTLGQSCITLGSFLGVLLAFDPLLAGVLALAVLPQVFVQMRFGRKRFGLFLGASPKERRVFYYGQILSAIPFAKELRLFTLAEHFLGAFRQLTHEIHHEQRQQRQGELRWQLALALLSSLAASGAFTVVVLQAFAGHLSLGDVTLYLNAVTSVQSTLTGMVMILSQANEQVLFYRQYTKLLGLPDSLPRSSHPRPVPPLASGITLRNVSFRYSPQQPWVLRHVNLTIPAGQCVALVGLNGAGKTTLVKLLTRLYDPIEGEILWDGIDLRHFDPDELRRHIGTIFQDFVRYDLTARENVGLGEVRRMQEREATRMAARKADIDEFIERLPQGYETLLRNWVIGRQGGVDLSGGEWQKIALARMFMREADLLMLDEPTAALDAQAENQLHQRFLEVMAGRSSLLITHRFSTVRMADAVVVLERGRVVEYGTHDQLLASKGTYARLYQMQAQHYQADGPLLTESTFKRGPSSSKVRPLRLRKL